MMGDEPKNKRQARQWIREYWAGLIRNADMGGAADMENDYLDEVWGDECYKISQRLGYKLSSRSNVFEDLPADPKAFGRVQNRRG